MKCVKKRQFKCTIQFVCKHNCCYETKYLRKNNQFIFYLFSCTRLKKRGHIVFVGLYVSRLKTKYWATIFHITISFAPIKHRRTRIKEGLNLSGDRH